MLLPYESTPSHVSTRAGNTNQNSELERIGILNGCRFTFEQGECRLLLFRRVHTRGRPRRYLRIIAFPVDTWSVSGVYGERAGPVGAVLLKRSSVLMGAVLTKKKWSEWIKSSVSRRNGNFGA